MIDLLVCLHSSSHAQEQAEKVPVKAGTKRKAVGKGAGKGGRKVKVLDTEEVGDAAGEEEAGDKVCGLVCTEVVLTGLSFGWLGISECTEQCFLRLGIGPNCPFIHRPQHVTCIVCDNLAVLVAPMCVCVQENGEKKT